MKDSLKTLIDRLANIGIDIKVTANIPWIYLSYVNGNKIQQEDYTANHGYTIAWLSIRVDNNEGIKLDDDLKETFRIIRKYSNVTPD